MTDPLGHARLTCCCCISTASYPSDHKLRSPQLLSFSDLDTEVVGGDNVVAGETSWSGFYTRPAA